jgi:hypothetical protein
MVKGADMAPIDLVRAGLEMIRAQGGEQLQHGVDFGLCGKEGVDGL